MPITVVVPGLELFDEENEVFITSEDTPITLEHSLVSLSKWESKWEKSFLSDDKKSDEETLSYIRLMGIPNEVPEDVMERITDDVLKEIYEYIEATMTATTFSGPQGSSVNRQRITNELIYYWMNTAGIDKECENWHLARLIALIKVTSEMNRPASDKKMSKADIMSRNKALNAQRKAQYNTTG